MGIGHAEMIVRIAVGAGLGAVIGLERDRHGRQPGLRTHLLVAMASATFMVVSAHFAFFQNYAGAQGIAVDPSRIAASVVTGIGFLAGGAILKTGLNVMGLTTGAGLWLVASIGLAAGAGMYPEAGAVTLMGLAALALLRRFEAKKAGWTRRKVSVVLDGAEDSLPALVQGLGQAGMRVSDFDFEQAPGSPGLSLTFLVQVPDRSGTGGLLKLLRSHPGVLGFHVRQPS